MSNDIIKWAIQEKAQIKASIAFLKGEDDNINKILIQAMDSVETKTFSTEVGTVTLKEVTRETIDRKKLPEELVKRGVPAETVAEAIAAAMKSSHSRYIEFRGARE